ncbi:MAG: Rrf2 family transcriptional regulator [Planctomycetes bacterium]|nr:Rrf2 family transcriptional regulator [Planctomycetota bacterium]
MFSQTTEYAIRVAIEIATRPAGEQVLSGELATALGIPHHYLAKILQQLVRARILSSTRGRQGGFMLVKPAGEVPLREIVAPFEDLKKCEECILGQPVCNAAGACPLHDFWKGVRESYLTVLATRTLQDLADFQLKRLNSMEAMLFSRVGTVPGKSAIKRRTRASRGKARK